MLLGAVVWTQWMAVGLAIGAVLALISLGVAYLRSVVRMKYPPSDPRRG